jgi:hypothetical protein
MQVQLEENEIRIILEMLDKTPVQGIQGMSAVMTIAAKLSNAIKPTNGIAPKVEAEEKKPIPRRRKSAEE